MLGSFAPAPFRKRASTFIRVYKSVTGSDPSMMERAWRNPPREALERLEKSHRYGGRNRGAGRACCGLDNCATAAGSSTGSAVSRSAIASGGSVGNRRRREDGVRCCICQARSIGQSTYQRQPRRTGLPISKAVFCLTDVPVSWYIGFAYKLNGGQSLSLQPQLPKWATTDHFDIEARAEGNPTKDQMRLMMQYVLADRFKLVVHTETRQLLVFALVPSKQGKTGPQLQPHSDDPPCASLLPSAVFPFPCGVPTSTPSGGQWTMGARNLTMAQIADYLSGPGDLDRPVVDRTGFSGKFDFHIEFVRQPNGPDITPKADPSGPMFLEALRDQLGLNLESTTGPVDVLVIDHVEEPSPN